MLSVLLSLGLFAPGAASELTTEPLPQDPAIYGGEPVEGTQFIETVYLRIGTFVCSGTLIAPDLVLTAAHCLDEEPEPEDICIMLGESAHAPSCWGASGDATAWNYGLHPDYCAECSEDAWDIGFIQLNEQVAGIDFPRVITDQDEYDSLVGEDERVIFVGYGQNETGEQDGKKRSVTAKITSFIDSAREFMAGGGGKDTCLGDSGGPVFAQTAEGSLRLVGVTSRGFPECGEGGVYTAPLPAMCWVEEQSGVELLPADCKNCDCVDLTTAVEGCGCQSDPDSPPGLELLLLLGLVFRRRVHR